MIHSSYRSFLSGERKDTGKEFLEHLYTVVLREGGSVSSVEQEALDNECRLRYGLLKETLEEEE